MTLGYAIGAPLPAGHVVDGVEGDGALLGVHAVDRLVSAVLGDPDDVDPEQSVEGVLQDILLVLRAPPEGVFQLLLSEAQLVGVLSPNPPNEGV